MTRHLKNSIFILIGTALMAFGLVYFNMQYNLADGGVTGITLLLYFLFEMNPAITNLIINIPLFFLLVGKCLDGLLSFIRYSAH